MQQFGPGGPVLVSRPPAWLWALPVFSCGFLAFVPPLVIAAKLRDTRIWGWAGAVMVTWFVGVAMMGSQPDGADNLWTNWGAMIFIGAWIGGLVFSLLMGPKVNWSPQAVGVPAPVYDANAAAIAEVQANRRKREEARALVQKDPLMARDLRIGRPDLPRNFDDGGLIDVNSAPAEALVRWLGLSPDQATNLVSSREVVEGFEQLEDLVNLAGLELSTYDEVKDRIILM